MNNMNNINNELLQIIKGLTKEQLITLWESTQENDNINTAHDWLVYLDNLPDITGFNKLVASNLLRVINDIADTYGSYDAVDDHMCEVKQKTKKMCLYFADFKEYFGCKTKKDMENVDLSIYKFE